MIYLHTGAPGAGKTLSAVEFLDQLVRENRERAEKGEPARQLFSNVNGISLPDVIPVDDDWMAHWWELAPGGSVIVIDEAQKIWRATRGGADPGRAVTDLETHRHDGIDIVMISQHPTFLHANIRKLVTRHVHMVEFTKKSALRWEWRECQDDVSDTKLRQGGEFKEWKYPDHLYQFYVSSADHTKRTKMPRALLKARIWMAIVACILLLMIGLGVRYLPGIWSKAHALTEAKKAAVVASDAPVPGGRSHVLTEAEYLAQQIPRVTAQPWSAPIYDGQAVTSHPRVFCLSVDDPHYCRCITEQGTRYAMPDDVCRDIALNGGAYDPYKPEKRSADPAPAVPPVQPSSAVPAAPVYAGVEQNGSAVGTASRGGVGAQVYQPPGTMPWDPDPFGGN